MISGGTDPATLLRRALELTEAIRAEVEAAVPERLDALLDEREAVLDALHSVDDGGEHAEAWRALRAADHRLREWLETEKQRTRQALEDLRSHQGDPFRERLVGPAALDQRV